MANEEKTPFKVVGVYDTETTNIQDESGWKAFPCLFIYNDLSGIDLREYVAGVSDTVYFYRYANDFLNKIAEVINTAAGAYVPIICAYNLMFDLQPIQFLLAQNYKCACCAQSSTHCYTFDLLDEYKNILLRFWDCYYLEMRGLRAMGQTAGLPKAVGDWDYTLIRTPETPLTENEKFYATRDVQVIPAYLRFLLESNFWLKPEMLGNVVLTKTSIVRQMAKNELGNIRFKFKNGKTGNLFNSFRFVCNQNSAQDFDQYALRKACFRGGFTFTSAKYAHTLQTNVCSLDVTSMHHLFINGVLTPQYFKKASPEFLTKLAQGILNRSRDYVLEYYYKPFHDAIHVVVKFENLQLKKGSAFEKFEIGLIPQAKFHQSVQRGNDENTRNIVAENDTRAGGYVDLACDAVFTYSKLMKAATCIMFVSEIELYALSRVYEWSDFEVLAGEYTAQFFRPCDYVSLQSNVLFEQKSAAKEINKYYVEGEPYTREIDKSVPGTISENLKAGTCSKQFVECWYNATIKGAFNGIYGTQAMNELRPSYKVESNGELEIDQETRVTPENFDDLKPQNSKVHYTYGMRIVGGSRLHLVLAIELLFEKLGDKIKILGGDTDSIKASVSRDIQDAQLLEALAPLHAAATNAINYVQYRIRTTYPNKASDLTNIGCFEIEKTNKRTGETRYPLHVECWNKARVSWDGVRSHVTCAGLSRPENSFTIEDFINSFVNAGFDFGEIVKICIGYNVVVDNSICHALERTQPETSAVFESDVCDYLGDVAHVVTFASCALYDAPRVLGDTFKIANAYNVNYQEANGRSMIIRPRCLKLSEESCIIEDTRTGEIIAQCKRIDRI